MSPEGATFADRHEVFSHVGSGEPPGAPRGSREVSGGSFGVSRGVILGPIWTLWGGFGTTFGVTFWKVSCPGSVRGVATCLRLQKSIAGASKADQLRLGAHKRSSSLENKTIGPEFKPTPLISQPLARIFHGKHLGGAVLPGVGGRGRRPFQSADPDGASACGAARNR